MKSSSDTSTIHMQTLLHTLSIAVVKSDLPSVKHWDSSDYRKTTETFVNYNFSLVISVCPSNDLKKASLTSSLYEVEKLMLM